MSTTGCLDPEVCSECGQSDHGQTGEYPCPSCALPTTWDKPDAAYFPELRRALAGDAEALSALHRLEASLAPVLATVERYGRVWAKDTDYYAAADVLGIKEPPDARA